MRAPCLPFPIPVRTPFAARPATCPRRRLRRLRRHRRPRRPQAAARPLPARPGRSADRRDADHRAVPRRSRRRRLPRQDPRRALPLRQHRRARRGRRRALRGPPLPRHHRHRARGRLARAGREARRRRPDPRLLPRHRAGPVRAGQPAARRARTGHRELAARPREADRSRPGLGTRDQRRGGGGVRGAPDLPDRPLPRQGERAEPARDPVRQHLPRAAVERQLHRPRADHGVGVDRRRQPGRLLRRVRGPARHGPEPSAAAALPGGDGASDLRRQGERPRREAQGAPGAATDRRR